jgi:tetratricopeptide (TPR) repeat protein
MVVIPTVLAVTTELSLRVFGFGYSTNAILTRRIGGRLMRCDNPDFGRGLFPPHLRSNLRPFVFPAEKPSNAYRVFILGSSAALGSPDYAYGCGRILHRMLSDRYPDAEIEVITVAMTAINSHVVLPIAKECARHEPDLFIVYLGNNEVVGPYGPGTVLSQLPRRSSAVQLRIALSSTRIGQLFERLGQSAAASAEMPMTRQASLLFLDNLVRSGSPGLESAYAHFAENLAGIRDAGLAAGAKVILCTVASNLRDCPPFAPQHRLGLSQVGEEQWARIYLEGEAYETAGDVVRAVERYTSALEIDDQHADLQYRLARCYWSLGKYEHAGERYIAARDLDSLRFRADTRINQVIRSVAEEQPGPDVRLADVVAAVADNSPHQVPGEELFFEHVHYTFMGNYLLARTALEQLETMIPERLSRARGHDGFLTEEQCANLLAHTRWDRRRIIGNVLQAHISGPPFTGQIYHEERVRRLGDQFRELSVHLRPPALENAAAEYRKAIQQYPSDWELRWRFSGLLAGGLKDYPESVAQLQEAIEYYPDFRILSQLGNGLRILGDLEEAEATYRRSLEITSSPGAHFGLARVLRAKGDLDGAITQFSKAVEVPFSGFDAAYLALADSLREAGKTDEAIRTLRKGIQTLPEAATASFHFRLALLLDQQGDTKQAVVEVREALRIIPGAGHPDHARFRRKLEELARKNPAR